MSKNEPGVNQIELLFGPILHDVAEPKFNIGELLRLRLAPGEVEFDIVDICGKYSAFWSDHPRHIESQIPAATANFQARHSRPNPHASQQIKRSRLHHARQNPQAFSSFNTTANNVVGGRRHFVSFPSGRFGRFFWA